MRMNALSRATPRLRAEDGFTMLVALGVMLVTGLLLVAAFTASNGDIRLSRIDTTQKQAYYAALAGVQEYEYQLQANPNYWQTCGTPQGSVPQESSARYEVKLLPANGTSACSSSNPFGTMIESTGVAANTFRIESVGCAGKSGVTSCVGQSPAIVSKRTIIATFKVEGFLNFVYFTQYEHEDPAAYGSSANCETYYSLTSGLPPGCNTLVFRKADSVEGPMHTDDAANVTCSSEVTFGRETHNPPDVVEINGKTWPTCGASAPIFYTTSKTYSKGAELIPPQSDSSLGAYVESANEFSGVTKVVLKGSSGSEGEITVTNNGVTETIGWPANGLLFVRNSACGYSYEQDESDTSSETSHETGCGTVYVQGTYKKSLTIAAENDVIINGSITPFGVTPPATGKAPAPLPGTAVLGLIATRFVRIYHPCTSSSSSGPLNDPWIYAAILSTAHSFVVDNHSCGKPLGQLNIFGAIAQKYRGSVGTTGGEGYVKNYNYDDRLATEEPPFYLNPLNAGWKVVRETSPTGG
jgi:Tfp pilus assembly protein PilX